MSNKPRGGTFRNAAVLLTLVALTADCQQPNSDSRSPRWLYDLDSDKPRERAAAEQSLRKAGTNALPDLIAMIGTTREREYSAMRGFEALGTVAEPAIPTLATLLTNRDTAPAAAICLAGIGSASVPVLLTGLTNRDSKVRSRSATALGAIDPPAQQAVAPLLRALEDPAPVVRTGATWALGAMKLDPDLVVPRLASMIDDTNHNTRFAAVAAISDYGSSGKLAIPRLEKALRDQDPLIQEAARSALKKLRKDDNKH